MSRPPIQVLPSQIIACTCAWFTVLGRLSTFVGTCAGNFSNYVSRVMPSAGPIEIHIANIFPHVRLCRVLLKTVAQTSTVAQTVLYHRKERR